MRRIVALALLVALSVGLLAPGMTRAQTVTPAPGGTASFGVPLGSTVPIIATDGTPMGTITVSNITDPFTGYDASSAPQRGYHYAVADVTVANTGAVPIDVNPSYLLGIDSDGFVSQQPFLTFTDPAQVAMQYTEALAPGASVAGVIPYELFGSTTLERIVYSPSYDRQITALDLRAAPVAPGTPVTILDTSGAPKAEVTVNGVTDPFTDYDSTSAPPRGSRYISLEVTVTNVGAGVLSTSTSDFWVVDTDGFVLSSTYVNRADLTVPDYTYLDLNPGESQHGILIYSVFEGVPPAQVSWGDGYTTLDVVADLSAGQGTAQTSGQTTTAPASQPPAATSAAGAPTTAAAQPTVAGTTAAVASNPDCAGLTPWGLDLVDRILRASELSSSFGSADLSTMTAAQVSDIAGQIRTMGDEQAASNPPVAATELNTFMVEQFYYPVADAIDQVAAAIESGNTASAMTAMQTAESLKSIFAEDGPYYEVANALTAECPVEMAELDAAMASNT